MTERLLSMALKAIQIQKYKVYAFDYLFHFIYENRWVYVKCFHVCTILRQRQWLEII